MVVAWLSRAPSARFKCLKRTASLLAHNRSSPKRSAGTRASSPSPCSQATAFVTLSAVERNPGAITSTRSPRRSMGRIRTVGGEPRSATHLQRVPLEETIDAVEIDDQRYPLLFLVEIALEFGRAGVHRLANGLRVLDMPAASEGEESLRLWAELAVEQADMDVSTAHSLDDPALGVAHPDGELRVAVGLHAAAEGQLGPPVETDVRNAQHASMFKSVVDGVAQRAAELQLGGGGLGAPAFGRP